MATVRKTASPADSVTEKASQVVELTTDMTHRVELTKEQVGALMATLSAGRVASRDVWQNGRNKTLSYVEAWDIKAALIRVFGFGGFSSEVIESKIIDIRDEGRQGYYPQDHKTKAGQIKTPYVMAYARVQLTIFGIGPGGRDAVYTEAAVGTNDGWTIGDVADNALKSAASDALKRCAINLGTQFGLSLYDNGTRGDVVKVLLNPEQAAMLKAYRDEHAPEQPNPQAEQQFAAALGAQAVTVEALPSSGQEVMDKMAATLTGQQVGNQSPDYEDPVVVDDEETASESGRPYPDSHGVYPQQSDEMPSRS